METSKLLVLMNLLDSFNFSISPNRRTLSLDPSGSDTYKSFFDFFFSILIFLGQKSFELVSTFFKFFLEGHVGIMCTRNIVLECIY